MTDGKHLKGLSAIVTGATSGLGRETALTLARCGCNVAATGRRKDRLISLKIEIEAMGCRCIIVAGDAADPSTCDEVISQTLRDFERIDILINNAGQGSYKPFLETSLEDYETLMASNMRSSFLFTRTAAPHFVSQRSGVIVFISSVAGLKGAAREAVYSASKFAQAGFAQSVEEELRPHGVRVCTVFPGGMKTEFAVGKGRLAEEVSNSWMMDARNVAETVVFVCSQPANVRIPELTIRHMGKPA